MGSRGKEFAGGFIDYIGKVAFESKGGSNGRGLANILDVEHGLETVVDDELKGGGRNGAEQLEGDAAV